MLEIGALSFLDKAANRYSVFFDSGRITNTLLCGAARLHCVGCIYFVVWSISSVVIAFFIAILRRVPLYFTLVSLSQNSGIPQQNEKSNHHSSLAAARCAKDTIDNAGVIQPDRGDQQKRTKVSNQHDTL